MKSIYDFRPDVEISKQIAAQVDPQLHQCYLNSYKALPLLPRGTQYVEGFATSQRLGSIPLEHGWCLLPDGATIVDVTWYDIAPCFYWPVKAYSFEEIQQTLEDMRRPTLPIGWSTVLPTAEQYLRFFQEMQKPDWPEE